MAIPLYLAMTAAEFSSCDALPPTLGWMACHFSPYGLGLSNLPPVLPEDAMVILNDRTPICGHDPKAVLRQLSEIPCARYLLDFQRPDWEETANLTALLVKELPHPVAVSHLYAEKMDCPVFLPPVPLRVPLESYLKPWYGREIWLEAATGREVITVNSAGSECFPGRFDPVQELPHFDRELFCHYKVEILDSEARFTVQRTPEDVMLLLEKAEEAGIRCAAGLYQELKQHAKTALQMQGGLERESRGIIN